MSDKPINITTSRSNDFPIRANYIFDNIGPGHSEDIIWQNVVDTVSEIEQNEIGVGVTQSYQYTKLHDKPIILTKWQGITTSNGPEFRIGLGDGIPGSKQTPPIMQGNFETGVQVNSDFSIQSVKLGSRQGKFCIHSDGRWFAIQIGEQVE
tara:strand:+ start:104 stop:556 length:453 start_codon:yes stop_codon:yes gene_type:complete